MGKIYKTEHMDITLQDGPIKEVGVNGAQVDEVVQFAHDRIAEFNEAYPCPENTQALVNLKQSLWWLAERTRNRTARGVEGLNKA